MSHPLSFTVTNESITVFLKKSPITVRQGAPNFEPLREALLKHDWEEARKHFTVPNSLVKWAKGKFSVEGDTISYQGEALPQELNERIVQMVASGESPEPLFRFWERLQKNPSFRSVQQLFPFLQHKGIPITPDGHFLAYKGVSSDYKDCHTRSVNNRPGNVHQMPRNKISDDPNQACHYGFHVGAKEYATSFGARTVICKVDPADVVCIPYDSSQQKMRVCRYKVISDFDQYDHLPDTIVQMEEAPDILNPVHGEEPKEEEITAPNGDEFSHLREMKRRELMKITLRELRSYATKGLSIPGASKIPGGKEALVKTILKQHRKLQKAVGG